MTRILLVEDSTDVLFLLQTELEWMGYAVDTAADGLTGLEIAQRNRPDVIVSDLQMPGLSGYEFIQRVRAVPELAGVPAIALTGRSMGKEVQLALASGFNTYLTKPVDGKTLADMINRQIGKALRQAS
jgi:CheY-like chemotaxis protein